MKFRGTRGIWLRFALLSVLVCAAGAARADIVNITSGVWQDAVLVRPTSIMSTDFTATTAGTVTIALLDAHTLVPQWGQILSALSGTVTTAAGDLSLAGGAMRMFQISANEIFSASIYAAVASASGYGAYELELRFTPSATTVPLPPSCVLLLSGVALLTTRFRRTGNSTGATVR